MVNNLAFRDAWNLSISHFLQAEYVLAQGGGRIRIDNQMAVCTGSVALAFIQ
jgi:hypothetical protein